MIRSSPGRVTACLDCHGCINPMNSHFSRITTDLAVCTGKPCIRGLRFPVARLLGLLAAGESRDAILAAYPYLEAADIDEVLRYAAFLAEDETVSLSPSAV